MAAWEQDVLPLRVPGYQPALLDALCAAGEAVWIGAGEGRVALYLRDDAPLLAAAAPPAGGTEVPGTVVTRVART